MSEQPKPFRGAFVFRSHDHQILTSTYFNTGDREPYPETAKRIKAGTIAQDSFAGTFRTVWLQGDGSYELNLEISRHAGSSLYELTWTGRAGVEYRGEGVLEKEILFGYYWGVPGE